MLMAFNTGVLEGFIPIAGTQEDVFKESFLMRRLSETGWC